MFEGYNIGNYQIVKFNNYYRPIELLTWCKLVEKLFCLKAITHYW